MSDDGYFLFPALAMSEKIPQVLHESCESHYRCGCFMQSTTTQQFSLFNFLMFYFLRDVQCCLQVSRQPGGSLGHPGILPSCPLRHRPPCCPEDPLDIPGSSLRVPSNRDTHAVRRIPWTSRDPPLDPPMVSFQTQAVYRILFLSNDKAQKFVVMITKYNNMSQESRIFEFAFFFTIVEVTYMYIQDIKHEMGSVHSSRDLGIP